MAADTFRVLVTGSRTWTDEDAIVDALARLSVEHDSALVVVHGGCPRGADAIAHAWCHSTGTAVERHPADWSTGRAAGHRRNAAMVATRPDLCLAFIRDGSPGATGCAALAERAGIPTVRHVHPTGTATSPYLDAALRYGETSWPVFLLGRSKRPVANCANCPSVRADPSHDPAACPCLTCHGPYAASTDPARIRAIFDAIPGGLLAVATGAGSGIIVIDVDPRHGGTIDRRLMPPTRCSATGNDGWHLFYRHPGTPVPNSQSRIAPGIDVRGEGGYAVLPPSIHPATHRPYRWANTRPVMEMPPPLITATRHEPAAHATSSSLATATGHRPSHSGGAGISHPDRLLSALVTRVVTTPKGRRRTTLYGVARRAARIVATGDITRPEAIAALTDAGRRAEQTERDIRAAIEGAFRDEGAPL
jgi:Bifunctional DNA primase/polymerase, N-terminal/YspA, cpYpsA-related SLOG family